MFDTTGTYDATFLVSGALGVLGGVLYLLILLTEKLQRTKRGESDPNTDAKEKESIRDESV